MPPHEDGFELIELNERAREEGNAGDFYKKIRFIETGEKMGDEIVAEFRF